MEKNSDYIKTKTIVKADKPHDLRKFIEAFVTLRDGDDEYFYIPYYFKKINDTEYEIVTFRNLPVDLQKPIQ